EERIHGTPRRLAHGRRPGKREPAKQNGARRSGLLQGKAWRSGLGAGRIAVAAGLGVAGAVPSARLADPQVVLHVPHPRQVFDAVFRAPLLPAAGHSAIEGDFAVLDADGYLTGIDSPVIGQGVGGVFQDPLVGPGVTHRAVPSVAVVAFAPI